MKDYSYIKKLARQPKLIFIMSIILIIGICSIILLFDKNENSFYSNSEEIAVSSENHLGFDYSEENGEVKIWVTGFYQFFDYRYKKIHVQVPEKISGKIYKKRWNPKKMKWENHSKEFFLADNTPVYGIRDRAFYYCKELKSITLPEGLVAIGSMSFVGTGLKSIAFPKTLVSIRDSAFQYCSELEKIILPQNIRSIGASAFAGCDALYKETGDKKIIIECPRTAFHGYPFRDEDFDDRRLDEGMLLANIKFSPEWTDDEKYMFLSRDLKEQVVYSEIEGPLIYTYTGENESDAKIYVLSLKKEVAREEIRSLVIPTTISGKIYKFYPPSSKIWNKSYAFLYRDPSAFIEVKNKPVVGIHSKAFSMCTSLKTIELPEGLTEIKDNAFWNCTSLQTIVLPEGLTEIGRLAFSRCTRLKTIELPKELTKIGKEAFYKCKSLKMLEFPKGLTIIGRRAFSDCTSLKTIELPEGLTEIDEAAFKKCTNLKTIELPEGLTEIGEETFYNCSSLESIVLPNDLTAIEDSLFAFCSSLKTVVLPENLMFIEKSAFQSCGLERIILPKNIRLVGIDSFNDCKNLDIGFDGKKKAITIHCSPKAFKDRSFSFLLKMMHKVLLAEPSFYHRDKFFSSIKGKKTGDDTEYLLTEENIEFNHPDWTLAKKKKIFKGSGITFTK